MEATQVNGPSKHTYVLLAIGSIESSHRFVPEQSFVTKASALPHVLDGDAQVGGSIGQNEVATRQLVHHKGAVSRRVLSPKLDC